MAQIDGKALKILLNTFWKGSTRIPEKEVKISDEDFRYAKSSGLMFEPVVLSHDKLVPQVRAVCKNIDLKVAASAFVSSLSARRLDLRSALGSYIVMRHLPEHHFSRRLGFCPECHFFEDDRPADLNVQNFERFKWGGARHTHIDYALLDLTQFARYQRTEPSTEDREILRAIVKSISEMPDNCSAKQCAKQLKGILPSNVQEREVVLAILGYCSILQDPQHPGFLDRFIPDSQRPLPDLEVSMANSTYPIAWWKSQHGVNQDALERVFGTFL